MTLATTPSYFTTRDGATIAYYYTPGSNPGVVFLTGFRSDMMGGKALRLESFCRNNGYSFLRFDYSGHGNSSGQFEDGTIGCWIEDAIDAITTLTDGPQVLVGSSMGGWIMLLVAERIPQRVLGLVGVAAAPDFTEELIVAQLTKQQWQLLEQGKMIYLANDGDHDPTPICLQLLIESRNHLVLKKEMSIDCPVRLIHGLRDADISWKTALRIQEKLRSKDVEVTLVKNGMHRLADESDFQRLEMTVGALLGQAKTNVAN